MTAGAAVGRRALALLAALACAGCNGGESAETPGADSRPAGEGGATAGPSRTDAQATSDLGADLVPSPAEKLCLQRACQSKPDCPEAFLDCVGGRCLQCKRDADCDPTIFPGGCDALGYCRPCAEDAHCSYGPRRCHPEHGYCMTCGADADCDVAGAPQLTGKCHRARGTCTRCDADGDCAYQGSVTPYCDTVAGYCIACRTHADCAPATGFTGHCSRLGFCNACEGDAECIAAFPAVTPQMECRRLQ